MSRLLSFLKDLLRSLSATDREPTVYETMSPRELADLPPFHERRPC